MYEAWSKTPRLGLVGMVRKRTRTSFFVWGDLGGGGRGGREGTGAYFETNPHKGSARPKRTTNPPCLLRFAFRLLGLQLLTWSVARPFHENLEEGSRAWLRLGL